MTTTPILSPSCDGGVLVASPSMVLRKQVLDHFDESGRNVQEARGGAEALVQLESGDWQLLYLDRRLPDLDAEELIGIIKHRFPGIEVVMLDSDSGQASPVFRDETQPPRCDQATSHWSAAVAKKFSDERMTEPLPGMIGSAPSMLQLYRMVRLVAARNTTVLLLGATGTGKELVASALHKLSPRASRPFVIVNCAAIPEALLESELFGHVRGAFTGAVQSHLGRIQAASGGTLFLDEIGELAPGLQSKLLRFLEQKEIQRLGGTDSLRVDVRVLAATNRNLMDRVEQGSFREDLYYRLAAFPIELPPLSDRICDVIPLAAHFLRRLSKDGCASLSSESIRLLEGHHWPGNVRELLHVIERAAILAEGEGTITPEHLCFPLLRHCGDTRRGSNHRALM